jgi:polar amino acid transport system ATP-binding protein
LQSFLSQADSSVPDDTAVLLIHLINPWGTAWRRRQTEDNVDLNRNFVDFGAPLPSNVRYETLRDALTPSQVDGPTWIESQRRIAEFRVTHGESGLAEAVFRGQYTDPKGVGFGGFAPTWSNHTLQAILSGYAHAAREVAFVDFHTGLGPFGHGALLSMEAVGSDELAAARAWYGESVIALKGNRREMPYDVQGDIGAAVAKLLPAARVVAVTLEFGTFELDEFLDLQVRDCWLQHHGEPHSPQGEEIRRQLQRFFYPRDRAWRESVRARGLEVIDQALTGLAETP